MWLHHHRAPGTHLHSWINSSKILSSLKVQCTDRNKEAAVFAAVVLCYMFLLFCIIYTSFLLVLD